MNNIEDLSVNFLQKYKIDTTPQQFLKVFLVIFAIWYIFELGVVSITKIQKKPNPLKELIISIVSGFVWSVTYFFIRRQLNVDVSGIDFTDDAIMGGLAIYAATLFRRSSLRIIDEYIN
jgi:RsiW-degrading membrane proteinase PrsW (M82 family)